jgi:predicted MPP superfamily phosphohydrolase
MNDLSFYTSLARTDWHKRRLQMETSGYRHTRSGIYPVHKLMKLVTATVAPLAAAVGLGRRAIENARSIRLTQLDIFLPALPEPFDGYRILLLSDVHVGRVPGLIENAAAIVRDVPADLAILAGDIQTLGTPAAAVAARELAPLLDAIDVRDGTFGVLGNHDTHDLVEAVEMLGVRMLVNEHHIVVRHGAALRLTGIDDVNYFYTEEADATLRTAQDGLPSIALVHSPEMADIAAEAGYALYLAGHTHGGQVCLPGGRPVYTALNRHHDLAAGAWSFGEMRGYTSRGVGVARPVRFNCPPEIALLRLRREPTRR